MNRILIFAILFFSCQSQAEKDAEKKQRELDSAITPEQMDSLRENSAKRVNEIMKAAYFDTVGVSTAPIQIVKAWLTRREYSNYKDIDLKYKNVSGKKISAIRFRWYGETAFGEPADMGTSMQEGFGGGFTDEEINPGSVRTSEWSIMSTNAKRVVRAWPIEIAFTDGTKWKSANKSQ